MPSEGLEVVGGTVLMGTFNFIMLKNNKVCLSFCTLDPGALNTKL